jgi:hypothetical protein
MDLLPIVVIAILTGFAIFSVPRGYRYLKTVWNKSHPYDTNGKFDPEKLFPGYGEYEKELIAYLRRPVGTPEQEEQIKRDIAALESGFMKSQGLK